MAKSQDHLRIATNEDGAAVLDTDCGTLTTLNPTGAFIWQALERGEDERAIVQHLAGATGEAAETVARDVEAFMAALYEQRIFPADEL
jgi:hypothetical protein